MSALATLKLVVGKKFNVVSPVVAKREKLIAKLAEQIAACEAQMNGQRFTARRVKSVVDAETGSRTAVETQTKVREWFWRAENGKFNLVIKYGAKTLMLGKGGKNAIEVANEAELLHTLKVLKAAVADGELDELIAEAASATRKGFGK